MAHQSDVPVVCGWGLCAVDTAFIATPNQVIYAFRTRERARVEQGKVGRNTTVLVGACGGGRDGGIQFCSPTTWDGGVGSKIVACES